MVPSVVRMIWGDFALVWEMYAAEMEYVMVHYPVVGLFVVLVVWNAAMGNVVCKLNPSFKQMCYIVMNTSQDVSAFLNNISLFPNHASIMWWPGNCHVNQSIQAALKLFKSLSISPKLCCSGLIFWFSLQYICQYWRRKKEDLKPHIVSRSSAQKTRCVSQWLRNHECSATVW